MTAFVLEYASQLLRWLHVIAAIAWIGESFYFVALDRGLKPAKAGTPGLHGESWSVHGGGFYLKQKFLPAPVELPETLHWSKWKSYTTWLSGFALFALVYLLSPQIWLIDPAVAALTPTRAVLLAIAFPLAGWFAYDGLCRAVGFRDRLLGALVGVAVLALCYGTAQWFAGRAAFLIAGATLATIMSANVFFVIIPGQKRMVAALSSGSAPNPLDGARGKQRSVHNTYFTLPVVFAMLSVHFGAAWAHPWNWAILAGFMAAGALIRQFFVAWHGGGRDWWLLLAGGALLLALGAMLAPAPRVETATPDVTADAQSASAPVTATAIPAEPDLRYIQGLLSIHCGDCHAAQPRLMALAPKGVMFDTDAQIAAQAAAIYQQTVVLKVMPPGNYTRLGDAERDAIRRWFESR